MHWIIMLTHTFNAHEVAKNYHIIIHSIPQLCNLYQMSLPLVLETATIEAKLVILLRDAASPTTFEPNRTSRMSQKVKSY